jgi:hypothetical protein
MMGRYTWPRSNLASNLPWTTRMMDCSVVFIKPSGEGGVKKCPLLSTLARPSLDVTPALKAFSVAWVIWLASAAWDCEM